MTVSVVQSAFTATLVRLCRRCNEVHLFHGHAHNWVVAPLRFAVNDLFIGQHSPQGRAPVDRHFCLISQALVEQLYEDPLSPPAHTRTSTCFPTAYLTAHFHRWMAVHLFHGCMCTSDTRQDSLKQLDMQNLVISAISGSDYDKAKSPEHRPCCVKPENALFISAAWDSLVEARVCRSQLTIPVI